jgi:hypothetical protein
MMLELDDIPVESLVPEPLRAVKGGEEYMARLPEFDKDMEVCILRAGGCTAGQAACALAPPPPPPPPPPTHAGPQAGGGPEAPAAV